MWPCNRCRRIRVEFDSGESSDAIKNISQAHEFAFVHIDAELWHKRCCAPILQNPEFNWHIRPNAYFTEICITGLPTGGGILHNSGRKSTETGGSGPRGN